MAARKKARTSRRRATAARSPVAQRARTGDPHRPGRPSIQWDEENAKDVHRMARAGNTVEDMAVILRVSKRALEYELAREESSVREAYHRGRAERRDVLRTAQLRLALRGNATMLIWLGKQDLRQRDVKRVEVIGEDGAPIAVKGDLGPVVSRKIAEFLRSRGKRRR